MNLLTHPFFTYFSDISARALAEYVDEVTINDDTLLFEEGDPSEHVYLVLEGKVELSKKAGDNRQISISTVKTGDYFGEWGVLDEHPRSTRATSRGVVRVAKIPGPPLIRILNQEPAYVTLQLVRTLLAHLRRTNDRFVESSIRKV